MMRRPLLALVPVLLVAPLARSAHAADAPSDTLAHVVPLAPVEVSTSRATDRSPFAVSKLGRDALRALDWGQDTPMALATLPGAYAYSDAGNGIGYSYLSLRGFPQRRISVLVNGVPLNDPESHEVYWIDHPDLLASTAEVQVQRGVGPALYGAAALGGSVNVETSPFSVAPAFAASVGGGSYSTRRVMLEGNSGALAGGWNLYGRYSRVETDGYRDQSWSRLWSYALSARHASATQSFRLNLYGGPEETHLAYLGIPPDYLNGLVTGNVDRDRRYNPLTYDGERDHFFEPHVELIHSWSPGRALTLTQTLFWFDGRGYYDEFRPGQALADYRLPGIATYDSTLYDTSYYARASGTFARDSLGRVTLERFDVTRRREIVDRHFGWVPRARLAHAGGALTLGGELRYHDGHHTGDVIAGNPLPPGTPNPSPYYDFTPHTLAAGVFAREEWDARRDWRVTADLAWRHEAYAFGHDRFDGVRFDQTYDFALPRLALSWTPGARWNAFASWALASREPALRDLYDAEGVGNPALFRTTSGGYAGPLVSPERVQDWELGGAWRGTSASATANLFRMLFRDELVYAGQFDTDLGYPILGNAARSVHQGAELSAAIERPLAAGLSGRLDANATLSDNHFVRYREEYAPGTTGEVSYDGKQLGLFPAVMANGAASLSWGALAVRAEVQHVGRIYVDNTETRANSIAPHTVLDLSGSLSRELAGAHASATLRVLDATDLRYETGGYMDYDASGNLVPMLTPAATRHWLAELRVDW